MKIKKNRGKLTRLSESFSLYRIPRIQLFHVSLRFAPFRPLPWVTGECEWRWVKWVVPPLDAALWHNFHMEEISNIWLWYFFRANYDLYIRFFCLFVCSFLFFFLSSFFFTSLPFFFLFFLYVDFFFFLSSFFFTSLPFFFLSFFFIRWFGFR